MLLPPRSSSFLKTESLRSWLGYAALVALVWFLARQGLFGWSAEADYGTHDLYPVGTLRLPGEAMDTNRSAVPEASGITRSSQPGVYWTLNDSGNDPRLYAVNDQGEVVGNVSVEGARNRDWECLTRVEKTIYIGDVGNDLNTRTDQQVYVVPEPDFKATSVKVSKTIPVPIPHRSEGWRNWNVDCEAMFCWQGQLYFVSKERQRFQLDAPSTHATVWWLDAEHNRMLEVDEHPDLEGWVTDADVSPDGKTLALLCQKPIQSIWMFSLPKTGQRVLSGQVRRETFRFAGQCEGLCFNADASGMVMVSEQVPEMGPSATGELTRVSKYHLFGFGFVPVMKPAGQMFDIDFQRERFRPWRNLRASPDSPAGGSDALPNPFQSPPPEP